jgi:hypothetical protein
MQNSFCVLTPNYESCVHDRTSVVYVTTFQTVGEIFIYPVSSEGGSALQVKK